MAGDQTRATCAPPRSPSIACACVGLQLEVGAAQPQLQVLQLLVRQVIIPIACTRRRLRRRSARVVLVLRLGHGCGERLGLGLDCGLLRLHRSPGEGSFRRGLEGAPEALVVEVGGRRALSVEDQTRGLRLLPLSEEHVAQSRGRRHGLAARTGRGGTREQRRA